MSRHLACLPLKARKVRFQEFRRLAKKKKKTHSALRDVEDWGK